jgi:hypothetical protein
VNLYKSVNIDSEFGSGLGFYSEGNKRWKVTSLVYAAKDLEPFDLPLSCLMIGTHVWDEKISVKEFAMHVKRCLDTDMDLPVIMDDEGFIMDGWHRVARGLFEGRETIKAVRFDKTPECDYEVIEDK